MVLLSAALSFIVVKSSLAKMLAVINQGVDVIEESKSAYYGLIFESRRVNGFSLLPTLAFGFRASRKKRL